MPIYDSVIPASGYVSAGRALRAAGVVLVGLFALVNGVKPYVAGVGGFTAVTANYFISETNCVVFNDLDFSKVITHTVEATYVVNGDGDMGIVSCINNKTGAQHTLVITKAFGSWSGRRVNVLGNNNAASSTGAITLPGDATLVNGNIIKLRAVYTPTSGVAGGFDYVFSIRREDSGGSQIYDYTSIWTGTTQADMGQVLGTGEPMLFGYDLGVYGLNRLTSFTINGTAVSVLPASRAVIAIGAADSQYSSAQRPTGGGLVMGARIAAIINATLGRADYLVLGGGMSGSTSAHWADQTTNNFFNPPYRPSLRGATATFTPDVAIIAVGVNDANTNNTFNAATYQANIEALCSDHPSPIPIVLVTSIYVNAGCTIGGFTDEATVNARIDQEHARHIIIRDAINAITPGRCVVADGRAVTASNSGGGDGLHLKTSTEAAAYATIVANAALSVMIPATTALSASPSPLQIIPRATLPIALTALQSGGTANPGATVTATVGGGLTGVTVASPVVAGAGGIANFAVVAASNASGSGTVTFSSSGVSVVVNVTVGTTLGSGGSRRRPTRARG